MPSANHKRESSGLNVQCAPILKQFLWSWRLPVQTGAYEPATTIQLRIIAWNSVLFHAGL